MNIGNDIIDLLADRSSDERFAQRALTPDELAHSAHRLGELPPICFFGVKEAFYKHMRQQDADFPLKPRSIEVDFDEKSVACGEKSLRFAWYANKEFFYSWTLPATGHHVVNTVCVLPIPLRSTPDDESRGVRELAQMLLSSVYGLPAEEFSFVKGPGGEPVAMHESDVLACVLSFTHHGRYCAVSYVAEGELRRDRITALKEMMATDTVLVQIENL